MNRVIPRENLTYPQNVHKWDRIVDNS